MVLGAAAWGHDGTAWVGTMVGSGLIIVADDLYKYGMAWLRYLQAWAVIAKLALLMVGLLAHDWLVHSLLAALVVGSLISHAPGRIRHFSLWAPREDPP